MNKSNNNYKEMTEIAYNLLYWLNNYSDNDNKIKISLKIIMNEIPILFYNELYKVNENLLKYLNKIDDDKGYLDKYIILHSFKDFFPIKNEEQLSRLCSSLHLDIIKNQTENIKYKELFEDKYEITKSYLLKEIYSQYIDEIYNIYNNYMNEVGKMVLDCNNNTTINGIKELLKRVDKNITNERINEYLTPYIEEDKIIEKIDPHKYYYYLKTIIYKPELIYNYKLI